MSFPKINFPVRAAWVLGVYVVSIFVVAFAWWISYTLFNSVQPTGSNLITQMGTNSTRSDQIEQFFQNLITYSPVLIIIGLSVWALRESQRRGLPLEP